MKLKKFLQMPVRTRSLLGDLINVTEHKVEYTLSPQETMEVNNFVRSLPPPMPGKTHAEVSDSWSWLLHSIGDVKPFLCLLAGLVHTVVMLP
jgi:hypothetical protein